jgi:hypothetical protein
MMLLDPKIYNDEDWIASQVQLNPRWDRKKEAFLWTQELVTNVDVTLAGTCHETCWCEAGRPRSGGRWKCGGYCVVDAHCRSNMTLDNEPDNSATSSQQAASGGTAKVGAVVVQPPPPPPW